MNLLKMCLVHHNTLTILWFHTGKKFIEEIWLLLEDWQEIIQSSIQLKLFLFVICFWKNICSTSFSIPNMLVGVISEPFVFGLIMRTFSVLCIRKGSYKLWLPKRLCPLSLLWSLRLHSFVFNSFMLYGFKNCCLKMSSPG